MGITGIYQSMKNRTTNTVARLRAFYGLSAYQAKVMANKAGSAAKKPVVYAKSKVAQAKGEEAVTFRSTSGI